MNSKEKCNWAKKIRAELAHKHNIPGFEYKECDFDGPCDGYCPKCDMEAEELYSLIREKKIQENTPQLPKSNDWEGDLRPHELILGRLESEEEQSYKVAKEDVIRNPRGIKKKKKEKKHDY